MIRHTVLILDESDVIDSKKTVNSSEITREDLTMPAYFDFVGAELVVIKLNGTESIMKSKREKQFLMYFNNDFK